MTNLEQKFEKLERQNKNYRRLSLVLFSILIGIVGIGATKDEIKDIVKTKRIEIIGMDGKVIGTFGGIDDPDSNRSMPFLRLDNPEGFPVINMFGYGDTGIAYLGQSDEGKAPIVLQGGGLPYNTRIGFYSKIAEDSYTLYNRGRNVITPSGVYIADNDNVNIISKHGFTTISNEESQKTVVYSGRRVDEFSSLMFPVPNDDLYGTGIIRYNKDEEVQGYSYSIYDPEGMITDIKWTKTATGGYTSGQSVSQEGIKFENNREGQYMCKAEYNATNRYMTIYDLNGAQINIGNQTLSYSDGSSKRFPANYIFSFDKDGNSMGSFPN